MHAAWLLNPPSQYTPPTPPVLPLPRWIALPPSADVRRPVHTQAPRNTWLTPSSGISLRSASPRRDTRPCCPHCPKSSSAPLRTSPAWSSSYAPRWPPRLRRRRAGAWASCRPGASPDPCCPSGGRTRTGRQTGAAASTAATHPHLSLSATRPLKAGPGLARVSRVHAYVRRCSCHFMLQLTYAFF